MPNTLPPGAMSGLEIGLFFCYTVRRLRNNRTRFSFKSVLFAFSALCAVVVFGVFAAVGLFFYLNSAPAAPQYTINSEGVRFEVKKGESAHSIGSRLYDAGFIRSSFFWDIVSRIDKDFLKSGVYTFYAPPKSTLELRAILEAGQDETVRVVVPEGLTIRKTARIFEEAGVLDASDFIKAAYSRALLADYGIAAQSAEGYLFPDTYIVPLGFLPERAVRMMLDTFFERLAEITGGKDTPSTELYDKVILASIVEREYRAREEAPLIAGVFYNRLEIGMRLQSCATVEYIITEIEDKPHPERIYYSDLEKQSPYNTYLYKNLPPSPIASPGKTALDAAFHPASTDYLYFVLADPAAGKHFFSKTYDEHNAASVFYLKN